MSKNKLKLVYLTATGSPPFNFKRDAYTYLEYHFFDEKGKEISEK